MDNDEIIERFARYLAAERRYSPLTVRNYRRNAERFAAWGAEASGGAFSLREARSEDIRSWIVSLSESGDMCSASINRTVASVRSLFRYLRREGEIERDLFAGISSLRTSRRLPTFVPDNRMAYVVREVLARLDSDDRRTRRDALMVLVFYTCGLRLAELTNIRRDDFTDGFSVLRVKGKGDKMRTVPLLDRVAREIKRGFERNYAENICSVDEKSLFLSSRGEPVSRSDVQRSVARLLRECGVKGKCSPHVLRHTFATHLLNDGADLREIQELMGHASLKATQVYTHNDIARLRQVYATAHPRSGGQALGTDEKSDDTDAATRTQSSRKT